jgi:hypothetical protein
VRVRRLGLRLACLGIGLAVFSVIAIQFEGILARNVALSHELGTTRAQLDALRAKKRRQLLDIARLQNPRGAIPEIHDRLKVVGPNEELIFVKGEPTAPPAGWEDDH